MKLCVSVFRRHWSHWIWSFSCREIILNVKWTDNLAVLKTDFGQLIWNTYFLHGGLQLLARNNFGKYNFFIVGSFGAKIVPPIFRHLQPNKMAYEKFKPNMSWYARTFIWGRHTNICHIANSQIIQLDPYPSGSGRLSFYMLTYLNIK